MKPEERWLPLLLMLQSSCRNEEVGVCISMANTSTDGNGNADTNLSISLQLDSSSNNNGSHLCSGFIGFSPKSVLRPGSNPKSESSLQFREL
ncbi:hypothetical protein V6N12_045244 [Hibiscus sabdariffa]|uniref:Uncharacterized protein n=1 Tax=Hibiscus sabdariffa TaxID=183260 RepID=A0ABR2G260_9ROSI